MRLKELEVESWQEKYLERKKKITTLNEDISDRRIKFCELISERLIETSSQKVFNLVSDHVVEGIFTRVQFFYKRLLRFYASSKRALCHLPYSFHFHNKQQMNFIEGIICITVIP